MRNELEELLKKNLRTLAIITRSRLGLTQKGMAKLLVMSESSYSDIETGMSMPGTLTTVLLLSLIEEPMAYLVDLRKELWRLLDEEVQPV